MIIINGAEPSKESLMVLKSLKEAVELALDRKRKLGQYAVVWDFKTDSPKYIY